MARKDIESAAVALGVATGRREALEWAAKELRRKLDEYDHADERQRTHGLRALARGAVARPLTDSWRARFAAVIAGVDRNFESHLQAEAHARAALVAVASKAKRWWWPWG